MFYRKSLALALALLSFSQLYAQQAPYSSATISGLTARNIGSARMSGRISAIVGAKDPSGRTIFYVGAASGGVWKSEDGGTRYKPVFDDQPVQSIGSLALDPSHPSTLWAGTGEAWTRNSVSIGDGIYRSTDGGDTWQNMGLPQSERIAKILIDPENSNIVYACVAGKLWSDSPDRGLYKTVDGGKTWRLVLRGANLSTGCSSLALDPVDPNVIFAALWDFRRKGWTFRSGGESAAARRREAACSDPRMVAQPGARSIRPAMPASRVNPMGASPSPSPRAMPSASTPMWNRPIARCTCRTTRARPGSRGTRAHGWCGARSILPISWSTRRIPIACSRPMAR
jgi:hypothetical protein